MENSPSHQGGSDLPLYDPPPSYEDVIKLYLPPPPPYSSIGRGRTRNNRNHSNGVENRGYRNDSPNTIHGHTRRGPRTHHPRLVLQDTTHPMILKVALPEEDEPPSSTSARDAICDTNSSQQNTVPQETLQTSPEQSQDDNVPGSSNNGPDVCQQSNVINRSVSSPLSERVDSEPVQSCDCQGACSCKLINKKKVARCSSESKVTITSGNSNLLVSGKAGISKKRSFKDMMQKSINRASSSAIIPHPASMTITVRPARSKKTDRKGDSKSAGPSSPTLKDPPEFICAKSNNQLVSSSHGHCRSSSGPSELSASLNCISNLSKADSEALPSQKCASENQILDASNLSQVKHLASVLFDGLQQSFSFRNEEASSSTQAISSEDDKTKYPVTWTNLLIPARKKAVEQGETSTPKTETVWSACDTLPLLSKGSQLPAIVKFDDKSTPAYKSSDTNQKFEEVLTTNGTD